MGMKNIVADGTVISLYFRAGSFHEAIVVILCDQSSGTGMDQYCY